MNDVAGRGIKDIGGRGEFGTASGASPPSRLFCMTVLILISEECSC